MRAVLFSPLPPPPERPSNVRPIQCGPEKTFFTADSLAFPDILPFPLLSRHRLSADLLALLYLHAVDEHAEVLADRYQRRVLVVKLHAQRSVHRLRDFGNRGGRLVADLVGVGRSRGLPLSI